MQLEKRVGRFLDMLGFLNKKRAMGSNDVLTDMRFIEQNSQDPDEVHMCIALCEELLKGIKR
jgi:hypothetical protein